mmetsp:Transcript_130549/g.338404  ORF Transcript_130549/g.338404 Transcript_130549/m.338404 type:complete len:208 (+) Transcript_130549:1396-2019(+)
MASWTSSMPVPVRSKFTALARTSLACRMSCSLMLSESPLIRGKLKSQPCHWSHVARSRRCSWDQTPWRTRSWSSARAFLLSSCNRRVRSGQPMGQATPQSTDSRLRDSNFQSLPPETRMSRRSVTGRLGNPIPAPTTPVAAADELPLLPPPSMPAAERPPLEDGAAEVPLPMPPVAAPAVGTPPAVAPDVEVPEDAAILPGLEGQGE